MKHVKIWKLNTDRTQTEIADCQLIDGIAKCTGEPALIEQFETEGIYHFDSKTPKKVFPKDGEEFLLQLKSNFSSSYYSAEEIE